MLSEIVKVVDGGGGDLKCCRPETFLVCRKNFPLIVETRRKIVNVVGKFQSCRRGGGAGEDFKMLSSGKIFGLSEKCFGLSEKYCTWPPLKHWSHGAT